MIRETCTPLRARRETKIWLGFSPRLLHPKKIGRTNTLTKRFCQSVFASKSPTMPASPGSRPAVRGAAFCPHPRSLLASRLAAQSSRRKHSRQSNPRPDCAMSRIDLLRPRGQTGTNLHMIAQQCRLLDPSRLCLLNDHRLGRKAPNRTSGRSIEWEVNPPG
jgi:hypothetical protein